jgi:hypothetical protein
MSETTLVVQNVTAADGAFADKANAAAVTRLYGTLK